MTSDNEHANNSLSTLDHWKQQCLAELQSRQKQADQDITNQVNRIQE